MTEANEPPESTHDRRSDTGTPATASDEAAEAAEIARASASVSAAEATAPAPKAVEAPPTGAAERWAPYVVSVLFALPILLAEYPPMTDLPFHETSVAILRHFNDTSMFPPGLYLHNFGHPNQLFHLTAWLLSYAMGTTMACKVVVACGVAGLPIAAARLATHLDASRWTALIVAPLAVGWLFYMGLVANILGLTLLLALFPALDRFLDNPTAKGAVRAILGAVVLYLAHEAMMFDYAAAALLFTLGYPLRSKATLTRLSVFVASVVITLAQLVYQAPLFTKATGKSAPMFVPLLMKIGGLPGVLFGAYAVPENRILFALTFLSMIGLGVQRWLAHRASGVPIPRGFSARIHAFRYELFAACCFAAYLAYPITLNGATLVYHRFLPPAFAVAAIVVSPRRRAAPEAPFVGPRIHAISIFTAAIIPVASLLTVWPAFADAGRNHRDVEKLVKQVAKGTAVATIALNAPNEHGFLRAALGIRVVAERGGRMLFSFTESPISPVLVDKRWEWEEPIQRTRPREYDYCPTYDFTRFRYLLLYSPDVQLEYVIAQSLKPEAKLVDVAGEWSLFESTLPLVPLETPDGVAPSPCPGGSLGMRMQKTHTELRELFSHVDANGNRIDKPPPVVPAVAPNAGGSAR